MIEFALDVSIEHLFDTDRHTAQMVSFYLMLMIGAFGLYRMACRLPAWYGVGKNYMAACYKRLCQEGIDYWRTSSTTRKLKWGAFLTLGAYLLIAGLFN